MKQRLFAGLLLSALIVACTQEEDVYPIGASKVKPMSLGQAVLMFMPDAGVKHIDWSYLNKSNNILWLDDTYKFNQSNPDDSLNFRTGLMRINVDGVKSTILKKTVKELAWSVVYQGPGNPNFGIQMIALTPGIDNGDANCFGSTTQNCTFNPINAIAKEGIKIDVVCKSTDVTGSTEVTGLELSAAGKKAIKARMITSGGSGGSSSWIEIYVNDNPSQLCS
jgi:hypothetical protein